MQAEDCATLTLLWQQLHRVEDPVPLHLQKDFETIQTSLKT